MSEAGRPRRVLLAKTSLDGHWRGVLVVARALRDAGFEVILGQGTREQIAEAAVQEGVDLVGLNVGGRIEVVERVIDELRARAAGVPILAGGTIPPWASKRLEARDVPVFPPGSAVEDIVETARRLTASSGGSGPSAS